MASAGRAERPRRRGRAAGLRFRRFGILGFGVLVLAVLGLAAAGTEAALASGRSIPLSPVLARRVIGYSVQHRPIVAYHLGDPYASRTALVVGQMHGDEPAGVTVASTLVRGSIPVGDLNLWVVPTMNPDGSAARTRQNAHHVDLNRNWPDHWQRLTGMYYSGPRPLSEPETRAMYRFILRIRPHYIVSLHQPLDGVDTTDGAGLDPAFHRRLVRDLGLPGKAFRCWGFCHGSMTGWLTDRRLGIAETVEFGAHPAQGYLTGRAPRGIVAALEG